MKYQPRYQIFVDHFGEGRPGWQFMEFIGWHSRQFNALHGDRATTQLPDEFTAFIKDNACRFKPDWAEVAK